MATTTITDPTGTAGWSTAVVTSDNTTGATTSTDYMLRNGGQLIQSNPAQPVLQPAPTVANPYATVLYTPPVATATLLFIEPNGAIVADYFGTGSDGHYTTDTFGSYSYNPDGTLLSTFFVNADGGTATRNFGTT